MLVTVALANQRVRRSSHWLSPLFCLMLVFALFCGLYACCLAGGCRLVVRGTLRACLGVPGRRCFMVLRWLVLGAEGAISVVAVVFVAVYRSPQHATAFGA